MSLDSNIHRLVKLIRSVPQDATRWIDVAAEIGRVLGVHGVGAILHRTDKPEVLSFAVSGYPGADYDKTLSEYVEHFHAQNPQVLFERARSEQLYYLDGHDAIFTPENFPDFTKWERDRIGVRYHATAYCRPANHLVYGFTFSGSNATGPIASSDLDLFYFLTENLRQSVATADRLGVLTSNLTNPRGSFEALIESLHFGAAILDRLGEIKYANSALSNIFAQNDGVYFQNGRIRLSQSEENSRFQRLCSAAAKLLRGEKGTGGQMRASRPSGKRPYVINVSPVPLIMKHEAYITDTLLVTIHDIDLPQILSEALLMDLFTFTRAEARIASLLMELGRLDAVAASLGISMATLRVHLRKIFDKSETHSQAELLSVLSRLPTQNPG